MNERRQGLLAELKLEQSPELLSELRSQFADVARRAAEREDRVCCRRCLERAAAVFETGVRQ